jgi:integrase
MSIYKRKETWWIKFTAPDGRRIQQSAGTKIKHEAQQLHDHMKSEAWRVGNLGDKPRYIWQEAVTRWLQEQAHKRSIGDDKKHLIWLHSHLFNFELTAISKTKIEEIKQAKLTTGVSNATVNRVLAVLRAILNRAVKEWEWLDKAPHVRLLPEAERRVRWLKQEEARRLISELPEHLAAMMRFTLATGLRESNVTQLEWSQVDLQRRCAWIHADQAKAKKAITVPLNDQALSVLREQMGKNETFVFTYKGEPVGRANNHAWHKALKRAEIENFRWHDLRHTWASWHIQNGTPLHALQELGGWSESEMVQRYAHLSPLHLSAYANNVSVETETEGTNWLHSQKNPVAKIARRA